MNQIDAETLSLLARALDRDNPDTRPGPSAVPAPAAQGDLWLLDELACRLGDADHEVTPPDDAARALAGRLARRAIADLRGILCDPEPGAQGLRLHLVRDGDEVLGVITRSLSLAQGLRPALVPVLAAMVLRESGQTTLQGLCARWSGVQGRCPD